MTRAALRAEPGPANDNARGCANAGVERALDAMRARPSEPWTVARLAKVAWMSRATFARHFARELGTSPLAWLSAHRLALATRRLLTTDEGLARIAVEIGYANEFAFSRAFKRRVGIAPSVFRRAPARAPLATMRASLRAA